MPNLTPKDIFNGFHGSDYGVTNRSNTAARDYEKL